MLAPAERPHDPLEGIVVVTRWLVDLFAGPVSAQVLAGPHPATGLPARLATPIDRLRRLPGEVASGAVASEAERVRLMVNAPGGIPAPPYASWWLERTLDGAAAARAAAVYREDGLDADRAAGPPDALAVQLEYLLFLLQHQRAARATNQPNLEVAARAREAEFLAEHLAPWIPAFTAAVRGATRQPEWLAAVESLEALLAAEQARVGGCS